MRPLHASAGSQETGHGEHRFTCTLTQAGEPACTSCARVTITDAEGGTARGRPRHAVAALDGITGVRVDWAGSRGLNEHERQALGAVRGA
jgi:hypothetical protein